MNDKDKEAFIKYMGENLPYSYYVSYHCPELKTWQAACEYKQNELTVIMEVDDKNKLKIHYLDAGKQIQKLQAENKKLREALEFYISKNDGGYLAKKVLKEVEDE